MHSRSRSSRAATVTRTRARTEEAKRARGALLVSAAERLFASRDFEDISIAEITRAAGLAKGTFYLYFESKEALFLHLLSREMSAWFDDARAALSGSPKRIASKIASALGKRPALIRLLGLLHPVFELKVDPNVLAAFKSDLVTLTANSAAVLERSLGLRPGMGTRLTLWMHALTVGLAQIASPRPAVRRALATRPAAATFELDFEQEIAAALSALFSGAETDRARFA